MSIFLAGLLRSLARVLALRFLEHTHVSDVIQDVIHPESPTSIDDPDGERIVRIKVPTDSRHYGRRRAVLDKTSEPDRP